MFTNTRLKQGQSFPALPQHDPRWRELLEALEITVDPNQDLLPQLARYGVGWVENLPQYRKAWHASNIWRSPKLEALKNAGFVQEIAPVQANPDYVVVDGGSTHRYNYRLAFIEDMQQKSLLRSSTIVVFGGQSLRDSNKDNTLKLTAITNGLLAQAIDPWAKSWIAQELLKNPDNPDPWKRPFATEYELGLLCLLQRYGSKLHHLSHRKRLGATTIHKSIPIPAMAATDFQLRDQRITLLNAAAKIREHVGRKKSLDQARPTGRSCFNEWLKLDNPPKDSSVLLITHAPNIYRSWFDLILCAAEAGRKDLRITAAGPQLEPTENVGDVLVGVGDLFINFYNLAYEGGIDSPETTSFNMDKV